MVGATGLEPALPESEVDKESTSCAHGSNADAHIDAQSSQRDSELKQIAEAWPSLSDELRRAILAIVAAGGLRK